MQERRSAARIRLNLRSRWESLKTQGRGTVCDLSSTGCFVLTRADVNSRELVLLEIHFPQDVVTLWGEVVYSIDEMGFALRFKFARQDEKHALDKLIDSLAHQ